MWDETNELWVVTRYDDIVDIEKNKHVFINSDKDKGGYRPNIRPTVRSSAPTIRSTSPAETSSRVGSRREP